MTVSTLTVVPEAFASGTAPCAEPLATDTREHWLARAARPDLAAWLDHVKPAAGCTSPIRLAGDIFTVRVNRQSGHWAILSSVSTADMPDGAIYKPCGNRRASVCPSCSGVYKRDAYHLIRAGLVGGKGVPETVATHPAVFPTLTAPSFGEVHTRAVKRHTCTDRRRCDCRPEPCHARRDTPRCAHGRPLACFARHEGTDVQLGTPLCLECYDHDAQVVWNSQTGELWRRTRIAIDRFLRRRAKARGIDPDSVRVQYGKAAEMQRRGVIHFHAIIRLDGTCPGQRGVILPCPAGLDAADLVDAVDHAAATTTFTTEPHPVRLAGWTIGWGEQVKTRIITVAADGDVTDGMVAGYLAKYATKSTEVTGHTAARITTETVNVYADPDGTHLERLVDACWMLGRPGKWRRLRRWAHMLGFGGHFFTKSRQYSITFTFLRGQRIAWRRTVTTGPGPDDQAPQRETTLVVNFLQFVGAGWHTAGDALLANASAALAREHLEKALADLAASAL